MGARPARRAPMMTVERADFDTLEGMVGDRWQGRPGGNRQVTLITEESVWAIGRFLGGRTVAPQDLRRNIVVSGINLLALKDRRVALGSAVFEVTGECHPCSRMEEILGSGGYNAVRGQGGVTARVAVAGVVSVGDAVWRA